MENQHILPIWQPLGYSTHIIAKKVSEKLAVKTSHTGTLDPMAEGVIIVLLGEERLKKYEYAKWIKGYILEIAFGIKTDTLDGMGKILGVEHKSIPDEALVKNVIGSFVGKYEQTVPAYSAIKIRGKPLHQHAREELPVVLPKRQGEIFKLDILSKEKVNILKLADENIEKIKKVSGNFRQEEVLKDWEKLKNEEFVICRLKLYAETSKGIYVRALTQDICNSLGVSGYTSSIVRSRNGIYAEENSKTLKYVFEREFASSEEFNQI